MESQDDTPLHRLGGPSHVDPLLPCPEAAGDGFSADQQWQVTSLSARDSRLAAARPWLECSIHIQRCLQSSKRGRNMWREQAVPLLEPACGLQWARCQFDSGYSKQASPTSPAMGRCARRHIARAQLPVRPCSIPRSLAFRTWLVLYDGQSMASCRPSTCQDHVRLSLCIPAR